MVAEVSASTLTYFYDGVALGNSYKVSIASVTLIGEGPKSNPLTIWSVEVPSAPSIQIIDTSRSSCSVQWTSVVPPYPTLITGYIVMIDDGLDGAFSIGYNGLSNPSKFEATIENLEMQTTYRLKVYATNIAGGGEVSDFVTCYTVTTPGQSGKPELISSTDTSIEMKWAPAYDDGGSPIREY